MWPFGDASIGFVGIEQGFFKDVGITLVPPTARRDSWTRRPGELLSGQLDISSGYPPIVIQLFPNQPDIRMVQLHDIYVGN